MISEFVKNLVELINEDAKKHDFTKDSPAPNINGFLVRMHKLFLDSQRNAYFVYFYDASSIKNNSFVWVDSFSNHEITEAEYILIKDAIDDWDKCKKEFREKYIQHMIVNPDLKRIETVVLD